MVEVKNISKKYGKKVVLSNVSFSAKPGEIVALKGRNGSGKSTLLDIMAGIQKADSGEVIFFDKNIASIRKNKEHVVGFVPQENPLIEELTVRDNLKIWMQEANSQTREVINSFGLSDLLNKKVSTLSGGMKRRLSIAIAVINNPKVVLMDEPTSALDFDYQNIIKEWMLQFQNNQGIIIFSTHNKEELTIANKIIEM